MEKDIFGIIGCLFIYMGNVGVLLWVFFYVSVLGREGMYCVGEFFMLNVNYMMKKVVVVGF